jgi:DNA-directed RNA polymerase sigma subunit (sigma70/sigma32)
VSKDWPRYAKALDMRLAGATFNEIAAEFGVSKQRARQMVVLAKQQLAFRVFRGLPRPLPPPRY